MSQVITNGKNVLFVTNDDLVYGLGDNTEGCLSLGNNNPVYTPQMIPALCQQHIQQFISGKNFVLAINKSNQIYSWGCNMLCQLAREPRGFFQLVDLIEYFDDKNIIQVSCGYEHSLALSFDGQVYGWGSNFEGQIGCGDKGDDNTILPIQLKFTGGHLIKYIYCHANCSFAITMDGSILSWGSNENYHLDDKELVVKEVESLLKVRSEYVAEYYDIWQERDVIYIQLELCSDSLTNILRLKPQVVHRNLKPDNILIARNVRNGKFVKLCDFGLVTVHDKRILCGQLDVGELRYIAPEVYKDHKNL
ncbi:unnamed protein product [Oppiella nova]|uniref:Protein kinase domain-containing protein n=1 Tax=Oppiella nova TaxID=334625 RepID=A0A7R9LJB6_9ACAR|nr:unnamed protein product [Oppiella nova]CAG2163550.1 unnamed protein product [Oppiella nova]